MKQTSKLDSNNILKAQPVLKIKRLEESQDKVINLEVPVTSTAQGDDKSPNDGENEPPLKRARVENDNENDDDSDATTDCSALE